MKILPAALPLQLEPVNQTPGNTKTASNSFNNVFDKALENLNSSQLNSEETVKKFLTGEVKDLHTVMIALEEAKLTMQLAVEVRNKLIEAYQEMSRMQI
ncbi:flagellar hook-basal body complex protein FliE [Desulfoscipio geothermicus]|uniref:Flagellar hook-basal body complex protein FliE n=1 Tax=Desulfoscipio geothermicus DSM 3669 TaxID=1121426 RepID=A0A1I6CV26_9FIRM|nr:flagellar hook-basal body complex protein FliE [Desulfoscipio geothermicus]SFQ97010.1 flagellar hook-basal body complex protein FliE [Desulfoscipio geothermicus DSM 3669]